MRILLFLIFLTALSFAASWVADHDGAIHMTWLGYSIETTVTFLIFVLLLVSLTVASLFYFTIWLMSAPGEYRKTLLERKREKGLVALTEGFAAVAAGDAKQARQLTKKAKRALGEIGLTRLLSAQSAHLDGNISLEQEQYHAMLEDKSTEMIAIKGLLLAAKKEGDLTRAISLAEKAITLKGNTDWALSMLFSLYKRMQEWQKALGVLEKLYRKNIVEKSEYTHKKAVLSIAIGQKLAGQGETKESMNYLVRGYKELSDFAPAAIIYAKALVADNQQRKAIKQLEKSWNQMPHIALATYYMSLFENETAVKRMKQAERLYSMQSDHPDSHIIVAQTAIRCGELSKARSHLKLALAEEETKLICKLMAELETMENAGQDVVQKWYKRAEAAPHDENWICQSCSHIAHHWEASCVNCGTFDSYEWQTPGKQINVTPDILLG